MNYLKSIAFCLFGALAACSSAPADAPEVEETETADDELVAGTSTFYVARPDFRRCISPMCGGYWVSRVNRATTRCASGQYADACYVAELDLSRLGLSPSQESEVTSGIRMTADSAQVVFRGSVQPKSFGRFGNLGELRATEAWVARGSAKITGTFYRVSFSNIVCVRAPCPSYTEAKLNSTVRQNIHEIDFSGAPGSDADKGEAQGAAHSSLGVLVAGENAPGSSRSTVLDASQYFLKIDKAAAGLCSSDSDCGGGNICCYPCGIAGCQKQCVRPDPNVPPGAGGGGCPWLL